MKNTLDAAPAGGRILIWVCAAISLTVLPHVFHVHINIIVIFFILAAWKCLAVKFSRLLFSRWIIMLPAIIGFAAAAWHYGIPVGRDPGVSFLILFTGLKLLESRTRRDIKIVLILGCFMIITHFLYANGIAVVIYLFALVLLITWLLIQVSRARPLTDKTSDFRLILKLGIQALPAALILFFLFPRFAGALWLLQMDSDSAATGMSESLSMGAIADLVGSRETAFTATFPEGHMPPGGSRYWRGGVLWDTDGRNWVRGQLLDFIFPDPGAAGGGYAYEIKLESGAGRWLFALDLPVSLPRGAVLTSDYYLSRNHIDRLRPVYQLRSDTDHSNLVFDKTQYLRGTALPESAITPRLSGFVENRRIEAAADGATDSHEFARLLLRYFAENNFVYSLRPPILAGKSPVDEFLFDVQKGFCEHYAAAFVTLMRAAEIPSRIVIGYLGGEVNPKTNEIIVRQSDAHAWAEYWHPVDGWTRVDPTSAVAPERIENSIDYDLSILDNGDVRFASIELGFLRGLLREARWYRGLVKQQWQRWFVGFNLDRQKTLLKNLGIENIGLQGLIFTAFFISMVCLLSGGFLFHLRDKNKMDEAGKIYLDYCRKLEKIGLARKAAEGPLDFCRRCQSERPESKDNFQEITELYTLIRYCGGDSKANVKSLRALTNRLKTAG